MTAISQPRTLSADTPACQKRVYLFHSLLFSFRSRETARKKASVDLMADVYLRSAFQYNWSLPNEFVSGSSVRVKRDEKLV